MSFVRFLYLTLILLFTISSKAQNFAGFEQLSSKTSGTQSVTYAVKQDSLGILWIGSEEGILKYDANTVTTYNTYNGLPQNVSNRTTTLFIDSNNVVWGGLEKGVCYYNPDLDIFSPVNENKSFQPTLISCFAEGEKNNIWIGGYNGLWLYNKSTNTLNRELAEQAIQSIFHKDNLIIIGTATGLFLYEYTSKKVIQIPVPGKGTNINFIGEVADKILVGTKSGDIFSLDLAAKRVVAIPNAPTLSTPVTDIVSNTANELFLATDGGGLYLLDSLFNIKKQYVENTNNPASLTSNGIYDLEVGVQGNLWIATYGGGINYINFKALPFETIQHELNNTNSLVANFTRAISQDNNGNLWFGTKLGISVFNPSKNE